MVALTEGYISTPPLINGQGHVAFIVSGPPRIVATNTSSAAALHIDPSSPKGVYIETQLGKPELVAAIGQQPPGTKEDSRFSSFGSLRFNANGDVSFASSIRGLLRPSTSDTAIFGRRSGEPLRLILREGQTVSSSDESEDGLGVRYLEYGHALGKDGLVTSPVQISSLPTDLRLVQESTDGALELLSNKVTVSTTIIRSSETEGDDYEIVPTTLEVSAIPIDTPSINVNGDATYRAWLVPPENHDTEFSEGYAVVKLGATGINQVLVQSGDTTPNGKNVFNILYRPTINANGEVAFAARLWGLNPPYGMFRTTADALSVVAMFGDPAPGFSNDTTLRFTNSSIWQNERNDVLFLSSLYGSEITVANDTALVIDRPGIGPAIVVREGDPAPGVEEGTFLQMPGLGISTVNNAGQVAFLSTLSGAGSSHDRGIWAQDRAGQLQLIVREGDVFDVSDPGEPADLRTIQYLSFYGNRGISTSTVLHGPAYGTAFNDRGQLAFAAEFTDGSFGVFVSNAVAVPEPMSALMLVGGVLMAAAYRTTRRRGT